MENGQTPIRAGRRRAADSRSAEAATKSAGGSPESSFLDLAGRTPEIPSPQERGREPEQ